MHKYSRGWINLYATIVYATICMYLSAHVIFFIPLKMNVVYTFWLRVPVRVALCMFVEATMFFSLFLDARAH